MAQGREVNANRLVPVTDWNADETTYAYDNANRMTTVTPASPPSASGLSLTAASRPGPAIAFLLPCLLPCWHSGLVSSPTRRWSHAVTLGGIWRSRLFLSVWFLVAFVLGAVLVYAKSADDGTDGYFVPDPNPSARPTVRADASAFIEESLRSEPNMGALLAERDLTVTNVGTAYRQGTPIGLGAHVALPSGPIEANGPWLRLHCQGTRQVEETAKYTNISVLWATIDDQGNVLGLAPGVVGADVQGRIIDPPKRDDSTLKQLAIRSVPDMAVLWNSEESLWPPSTLGCPPGTEDD